ncbi:DUF4229 domain-containing protein [Corynebacterium bovis]|uniref:DUF4229 domain-containing protein n=4 Tax=Corynebacterium bovis TaxID=36808 RepID=UPI0021AB4376|nr:DUF4229 domain-containing protein [Corynebacterium bovis]
MTARDTPSPAPSTSAGPDAAGTAGTTGDAAASDHPVSPVGRPARTPGERPRLGGGAVRDVVVYVILRLLMVVVLTVIIQSVAVLMGMAGYFPLLISLMLALIVALPLSVIMLRGLRFRVTAQLAEWDRGRREHKREMSRQLQERLNS